LAFGFDSPEGSGDSPDGCAGDLPDGCAGRELSRAPTGVSESGELAARWMMSGGGDGRMHFPIAKPITATRTMVIMGRAEAKVPKRWAH